MNGEVIPLGTERDTGAKLRQSWGGKIREVRELRQMSRARLAELVNVSEAAVGMWERGETAPRIQHQSRVAQALDVPHGVLFPMEGAA